MDDAIYMLIAIPFFFLLIGIELLIAKRKKIKLYRLNDAITNINVGIGNQLIGMVAKVFLIGAYVFTFEHIAIFKIPTTVWSVLILFILYDFTFYWAHRLGHEVNLFWGAHVVHHQSEDYNFSVALRQSWFHSLLSFFLFLPIPALGFEPGVFFVVATFNSLFQYWIHTKTIKKLPRWFEFIFNTPSHHRVHHGVNPKYIDKNHGGALIIWDRLFGSFQEEEESPIYGITTPLKSWNPVWANFHYYIELFQASKNFTSIKDKIKLIFAKPGWQPDYLGGPISVPEIDKENYTKYDESSNSQKSSYIFAQFLLVLVGTVAFLYHYENLSFFYKVLSLGGLILSILICGALFENKPWSKYLEYGRLGLVFIGLNSLYYIYYPDWFFLVLIVSLFTYIGCNSWFYLVQRASKVQ